MKFDKNVLDIDCNEESNRLAHFIRNCVFEDYKKRGIIIGVSGGIDSAVTAALAVKAVGKERVQGLMLPEKESNPLSTSYANLLISNLGIRKEIIDLTSILESFDVYQKRELIVKKYFTDFGDNWQFRLVMPQNLLEKDRFNIAYLQVKNPEGYVSAKRLSAEDYLEMVATTDIKQRVRMIMLYYYAEMHNYVVIGTTNKSELQQGFFVKYGDGGVDIEPITHLYKTQVFQLAKYLEIPEEIINRTPSPDTYSFEVSDKDFYFCLPYDVLDLLLYAREKKIPLHDLQMALKLDAQQIERAFRDIESKQRVTAHLRQLPKTLGESPPMFMYERGSHEKV